MKGSKQRKARAMTSVEYTSTYLIHVAERFSNASMTMHDQMGRRRELLEAARTYASAMRRLMMVR